MPLVCTPMVSTYPYLLKTMLQQTYSIHFKSSEGVQFSTIKAAEVDLFSVAEHLGNTALNSADSAIWAESNPHIQETSITLDRMSSLGTCCLSCTA